MASYPPKRAAAYTFEFPAFDGLGKYLTGATLTTTVSKDGGAFAATTNSPAEIGTTGVYALTLTATEMTADRVAVKIVVTGQMDIFAALETVTRQIDDLAFPATSGRSLAVETDGMVHGDVKEWLGVAPSALIAGRVDGNAQVVGDKTGYAIGTGGIAAAAFAANAVDAAALAASAAQEVADETLNRDIAGGASGGARTIRSALRKLRNRLAIAASTLTVYQEDDLTPDHTEAVTTTAGNPITETDPAT